MKMHSEFFGLIDSCPDHLQVYSTLDGAFMYQLRKHTWHGEIDKKNSYTIETKYDYVHIS